MFVDWVQRQKHRAGKESSTVDWGAAPLEQALGDGGNQGASAGAIDVSEDVIVTGSFEGTVDFGGGVLTSAGSADIFIAKFGL